MRLIAAVVACTAACLPALSSVVVTSVDRHVGVQACVFAPPSYPNWCDAYGGANTTTGLWTDSGVFGNSAAGDIGYGTSTTIAGQYGTVENTGFQCSGGSTVEITSAGTCGSSGSAQSYMYVTFEVLSTIVAQLSGGTSGAGATYQVSLAPQFGDPIFVSSAGDYVTERTLPPGTYVFRAASFADGACSGGCSQVETAQWNTSVLFVAAPCPADLNGDTVVDDADFVLFVSAYNELLCPEHPTPCPADLNGDMLVEDTDFSVFAVAYDTLLCP